MDRNRKLTIDKVELISLATEQLEAAQKTYEKEKAEFQLRVLDTLTEAIGKMEKLQARVAKARTIKAVNKVIRNTGRYLDFPSTPSNGDVCRWSNRIDWLMASTSDRISLTQHEFSEYKKSVC